MKCIICNNETSFNNKLNKYNECCSIQCSRKNGSRKARQTKLERYGSSNYNNVDKMLKTKIENDSYTKMKETHKNTRLEKYGVDEKKEQEIDIFFTKFHNKHQHEKTKKLYIRT